MDSKNIEIKHFGPAESWQISKLMMEHHLLFLPTLGENFGHVIIEALTCGCPVLISDKTPWKNLEEKGIGWDIQLNDEEGFLKALQYCVDMDEKTHRLWSQKAYEFGYECGQSDEVLEANRKLFQNTGE